MPAFFSSDRGPAVCPWRALSASGSSTAVTYSVSAPWRSQPSNLPRGPVPKPLESVQMCPLPRPKAIVRRNGSQISCTVQGAYSVASVDSATTRHGCWREGPSNPGLPGLTSYSREHPQAHSERGRKVRYGYPGGQSE